MDESEFGRVAPGTSTRVKLATAGIALLAVFGWFFYSVLDSGVGVMQYYHTLTELQTSLKAGQIDIDEVTLRLNGFVEEGTIRRDIQASEITFVMTDGAVRQPVHIGRLDVSDLFKDGANVVVEGHLHEDGVFYADELLAKCPTKYQAAEDAQQAAREPAPAAAM